MSGQAKWADLFGAAPDFPCPTCQGPSRETVGLVCQTCGRDYGSPAVDRIADAHHWSGGYYCSCGHELNSPRGFTRHVVAMTLAEVAK